MKDRQPRPITRMTPTCTDCSAATQPLGLQTTLSRIAELEATQDDDPVAKTACGLEGVAEAVQPVRRATARPGPQMRADDLEDGRGQNKVAGLHWVRLELRQLPVAGRRGIVGQDRDSAREQT